MVEEETGEGELTSLRSMTSVSPRTTPYQRSQSELLAAKEANRFMCSVIREHFSDLVVKRG